MSSRFATLAVLLLFAAAAPVMAQKANEKASGKSGTMSTAAYLDALRLNTSTAGRVALAEAAGPTSIAHDATIIDMRSPTEAKTLRAGTNGWTCVADPNGPVCMDQTFMAFMGALMNKLQPNTSKVGIAYMLVGDMGASLTDPYATADKPPADWVKSGSHTMVIVPDAAMLAGFPDKASAGGPYVMWKGTPYAHLMVPSK